MSEDEFKIKEELKCRIKSKNDLDALKVLAQKIKTRTDYGRRTEITEGRGYILMWSNASRAWLPWGYAIERKDKELELDSNMIFAPFSKKVLEPILPCLPTLPLYYMSTEAKERGEVDVFEATIKWLEAQLIKQENKKMQEEMR